MGCKGASPLAGELGQSPRSQKQKQGGSETARAWRKTGAINPPCLYWSAKRRRQAPQALIYIEEATETLAPEKTLRCFRGSKAGPWLQRSGSARTRRFEIHSTPALQKAMGGFTSQTLQQGSLLPCTPSCLRHDLPLDHRVQRKLLPRQADNHILQVLLLVPRVGFQRRPRFQPPRIP